MIPESKDPIEEYKICQEKVINLENHVWKVATIFGIGSFVGIVGINLINLKPEISFIIGLVAIGFLITWWRIARRWWSIEHATLFRMKEIENIIGFQTNLIIENLDKKKRGEELPEDWKNYNFRELPNNYEFHGIQPVMRFILGINIIAWIVFMLFQIINPDDNVTILYLKIKNTYWITSIMVLGFIVLYLEFYEKGK